MVRLAPQYRNEIDQVRNVKVAYQAAAGINAYIPLSELANISLDTGASYIYHERMSAISRSNSASAVATLEVRLPRPRSVSHNA